jgi:hypothetical protein
MRGSGVLPWVGAYAVRVKSRFRPAWEEWDRQGLLTIHYGLLLSSFLWAKPQRNTLYQMFLSLVKDSDKTTHERKTTTIRSAALLCGLFLNRCCATATAQLSLPPISLLISSKSCILGLPGLL